MYEEDKSLLLIEGKDLIEETLASLKMLCMIFKVDFNKEYLKGLLDEKIKSNQTNYNKIKQHTNMSSSNPWKSSKSNNNLSIL